MSAIDLNGLDAIRLTFIDGATVDVPMKYVDSLKLSAKEFQTIESEEPQLFYETFGIVTLKGCANRGFKVYDQNEQYEGRFTLFERFVDIKTDLRMIECFRERKVIKRYYIHYDWMGIMHFMSRLQKAQVDPDKYVFMISPISEPYRVQDFMSRWYTPVERDEFVEWLDNVLDKANLEAVKEAVLADFGAIDILINGAGGNNPKATTDNEFHELDLPAETKTFFDLDKSGIEFVFNLNYLGTLLPTQVFAKEMVGRKGANIINISSMNAFTPLTKIPAYSGAKAAISNFTQWLAVHFSKVGIRCNAIAPGFLVTNQNRGLLFDESGEPTARAHKILMNTPMNRFGEAEELVGGVFFLADESMASFVNGVILPIDGGFAAYSGV